MNANDFYVTQLLEGEKQYFIPIYQRKYSWGKDQCKKLLSDIIAVGRDNGRPCHFIGSLIYLEKPNQHASAISEYLVVDGQQRLTTISIILLALGDYTKIRIKDGKYDKVATGLEKIKRKYLVNEDDQGDLYYKIKLNEEDFKAWKELIRDRELSDAFKNSEIFKNYRIIYDEMVRLEVEPQLVFDGIKKLKFVDICLAPEDNAQLIFESVNSTGLPLKTADKIRNFLLMEAGDEQAELYSRYWHQMEIHLGMVSGTTEEFDTFFRYYMTLVTQKSVSYDFYDIFKRYYFVNRSSMGPNALVEQIYQYSEYYRQWIKAAERGDRVEKALYRLRETGQLKITPVILKLLSDRGEGVLSEDNLIEILTIMEAYWMRRQVCCLPSNTAGPVCISMLKSLDSEDKVKSFKRNILSLTWAQRMPDDSEIRNTLKTLKIYGINAGRTKKILDRLENNKRKEYVPTAEYTIEHIMPETLSDGWREDLGEDAERIFDSYLHTIGNLTLTGYNSEYKNKRFAEKKDCLDGNGRHIGYRHTPIKLSSYLKTVDKWGEEEILHRTELMADEIISIWRYPEMEE